MPLLLNTTLSVILLVLLILGIAIAATIYYLKRSKERPRVLVSEPAVQQASQSNCYEDAYRLIPDGIVVLNADNNFIYVNPAAEEMLDCRLRSVMGRSYKNIFDLFHLKTKRTLQGIFTDELIGLNKLVSFECLLKAAKSQAFPVNINIMPLEVYGESGNTSQSLFIIKNITEIKATELKLSDLEKHDSLTRMLNRRSFEAEAKHLVEGAQKHGLKHVLAYFSVDQYHAISDAVGYAGGDSLIIKMRDIVVKHLQTSSDIIGRVSEDEFAVIFCERKLVVVVKAIQAILSDVEVFEFTSMGHKYPSAMSVGFRVIDSDSTSSARVLAEAKSACHSARNRGENQLSAYKPGDNSIEEFKGHLDWVTTLKDAMKNNRFYMHAQPIHPLRAEKYTQPFYHYELLIRLSDEKGKPIFPDEFLPAAEYYSLMPAIDRWVVKTVLREVSKIPEQSPLPVFAINLSGQSLNDASFLDYVLNEVKTSGVDPQMLCFEITEQVAVEDLDLVNSFISSLKSLGSKFSLDDFGTGVSSYGYLRSLDVDYLKIDGSFVKSIVDDEVAKAMVQSINYVGHTMNLKVIAEYVENDEILNLLRAMGVDYGQGYHILRPIAFEDVLKQHITVEEHPFFIEN